VCVRSAVTGKTVVVRINDRGPFIGGRVIDLSQGAAQELGMTGLGIKPVELWLLNKSEEACPDALPDAPALAEADDDGVTATAPRQVVRKPAARKSRVVAPTSRARSRSIRR
jgi:rare lipoprotein A